MKEMMWFGRRARCKVKESLDDLRQECHCARRPTQSLKGVTDRTVVTEIRCQVSLNVNDGCLGVESLNIVGGRVTGQLPANIVRQHSHWTRAGVTRDVCGGCVPAVMPAAAILSSAATAVIATVILPAVMVKWWLGG
ncbi:unnamed protein product [Cuscuta europaea]|uniref:Uncharacterized protein n=1 Tax=Cuscuta europaea TaxID=41803 RepID=A0A9P0YYQ2_CUSEU|nr:unnamed protein product [Cuscuta europaea]